MQLFIEHKKWPVKGVFRISRSALTVIDTLWVTIKDGPYMGRGECRPYARYGDSIESVTAQIEALRADIKNHLTMEALQSRLPAGPARNALDCALWDLEAKRSGRRMWELLEIEPPRARQTAFTLSMNSPEAMGEAARDARDYPLLKIKIGAENALDAIAAVADARPDARIIIDANEALSGNVNAFYSRLGAHNIAMIEQPLPADTAITSPLPAGSIPFCADEGLHTVDDLQRLKREGYRAVNVKLDKCGGLTAALELMRVAKDEGFTVMAGCMVASSLAMAPMMTLESYADYIDLDGPLLLAKDCEEGLRYEGPIIRPPDRGLWG